MFQRYILGVFTRSNTDEIYVILEDKELQREMNWVMIKWSCSKPWRMIWLWICWRVLRALQDFKRFKITGETGEYNEDDDSQ